MVPGLARFDVAGDPPGKLHAYVIGLDIGAHALTVAWGDMVPGPQKSSIAVIETVGGLATVTVCELCVVPHEFVVDNVMVYVPASTKLKFAFVEA